MSNDEKIYPISSTEEEQLIDAPEGAHVQTRAVYPETEMTIPYDEQQASGPYQTPANPDRTPYKYNNQTKGVDGDRDATTSLCSLCCGISVCASLFACCLGCVKCCCCTDCVPDENQTSL